MASRIPLTTEQGAGKRRWALLDLGRITKLSLTAIAALTLSAIAVAATITSEDFEGGASGWNTNSTTDGGATFTEFLGRFGGTGGTEAISKTYGLSGLQTEVTIAFDFYEIDSWDFENFIIYVNGSAVFTNQFKHNREDFSASPSMDAVSLLFVGDDGNVNYGYGSFPDQGYRYEFTVNTTDTNLSLGFGTTLNSVISDESWGIDNVYITDNAATSVSSPSILLLMSATLIGIPLVRRRLEKNGVA